MEKPVVTMGEIVSFIMMLLMFLALAAGQAGEALRQAANPAQDVSSEIEYFRGEDE